MRVIHCTYSLTTLYLPLSHTPGQGTLHAKFDVTSGPTVPAPATVHFLCDGATMSGLTFELTSDAYRVSLTKNKCLSGIKKCYLCRH